MILNMSKTSNEFLFETLNTDNLEKFRLSQRHVILSDVILKKAAETESASLNTSIEDKENTETSFKFIKLVTIKQAFMLFSFFSKHILNLAKYKAPTEM
jgi:hypothetical protein